jgi:hypothetical protein
LRQLPPHQFGNRGLRPAFGVIAHKLLLVNSFTHGRVAAAAKIGQGMALSELTTFVSSFSRDAAADHLGNLFLIIVA